MEKEKRLEEMAQQVGMSVMELNATLKKSNFLPPGVEPTSIEALEYCRALGRTKTFIGRPQRAMHVI